MSQQGPDPATMIFCVIGSIVVLFVCLIAGGVLDDVIQLIAPNPDNELQDPSPQLPQ